LAVNKIRLSLKQKPITEWILRDIMQKNNIFAKLLKQKKYVDKKYMNCKFKDLIKRNWFTTKPGTKLFTDVTYFHTPDGFVYISSIIDTYDWKIIGHAVSKRNDNKLVMRSLNSITRNINGAIIHSDHGYQYSSHEYVEWCKKRNIKISMSRKGNSLDNYPIEHHWSFLKSECLSYIQYNKRTFDKIKKAVDKYYIWFNNERINSFSLKK
jgi:transposase InsO family protein